MYPNGMYIARTWNKPHFEHFSKLPNFYPTLTLHKTRNKVWKWKNKFHMYNTQPRYYITSITSSIKYFYFLRYYPLCVAKSNIFWPKNVKILPSQTKPNFKHIDVFGVQEMVLPWHDYEAGTYRNGPEAILCTSSVLNMSKIGIRNYLLYVCMSEGFHAPE